MPTKKTLIHPSQWPPSNPNNNKHNPPFYFHLHPQHSPLLTISIKYYNLDVTLPINKNKYNDKL